MIPARLMAFAAVALVLAVLAVPPALGRSLASSSEVMGRKDQSILVPVKGYMQVSDEVAPGMRIEKYRVPALTHWPDGRPAPKEAAPYVLIGVPEENY